MIEYLTFGIAVLVFLTSLVNYFAGKRRTQQLVELTMNVDGRLSQLLEASKQAAHLEGKLEGIVVVEDKAK